MFGGSLISHCCIYNILGLENASEKNPFNDDDDEDFHLVRSSSNKVGFITFLYRRRRRWRFVSKSYACDHLRNF